MGDHEFWLNAADISAVRVRCNHCESEAVFSGVDPTGPLAEIRCPNCNMLMAGAHDLVRAYRDFLAEVKRQKRGARFLAKVQPPS